MTDTMVYAVPAPRSTQRNPRSRASRQQAVQALLQGDTGSVEATGVNPSDQRLEGQYRHALAEKLATELKELANAGSIEAIPFFGIDERSPEDGYYTLSNATVSRVDGRVGVFQRFEASFTEIGTRASHRKEIATDVADVSHPFGNDQTALVGVPAQASKVQWFDSETGAKAEPTLVATRSGEHRDVDVYDARAPAIENPSLVCDLPYEEAGWCDPRVWDTSGEASRTDDDGLVQWQKVFVASHDYQGQAVLENELVWLAFDESAQSLTVRQWDGTSWTDVALGDSDWELFDVDVREIGLASVTAVVEFRDPTADPTAYYPLKLRLKRGWEWPLWTEIGGEGGTPPGLVDLLDPVASGSAYDPGESQGLRKRSEL